MKRGIMKFASAALLSAMLSNGWLVPSPEETMQLAMASLPAVATKTAAERATPNESPLETPGEASVTAVAEATAATSVKWERKPPVQEATIEVGFVIQPPEPPTEPAPTEENSTSWQPAPAQPVPSPEAKIPLGFVIRAPEPPTYTPEPKSTGMPQEESTPTPVPVDPIVPAPEPAPQPTEPPAEPTSESRQESTPQQPIETAKPAEPSEQGYALCSCGARLTPEELVPHMKAHALAGESHSYSAW